MQILRIFLVRTTLLTTDNTPLVWYNITHIFAQYLFLQNMMVSNFKIQNTEKVYDLSTNLLILPRKLKYEKTVSLFNRRDCYHDGYHDCECVSNCMSF